ncbi:MAG: polyphosphate kinase 1 [Ectothiorhodospiraceae bacterium]|nr:polyphosphate kinase 1 [Ectothiorhodospiraceae bacterium]
MSSEPKPVNESTRRKAPRLRSVPLPPASEDADPSLAAPELYVNRELSLLEFNRRVLAQAKDPEVPLLERMRFLCICSRNLDEFFEVRVAGLEKRLEFGQTQPGPDGLSVVETLARISEVAHDLVAEQYRVLNDALIPALQEQDVRFLPREGWGDGLRAWVERFFQREMLPLLTPMGLDPAHPFPRVLNKNLNFIVALTGKDAFGRSSGLAIVQVPRSLPRLIPVPMPHARGQHDFLFLSSVIHAHVEDLFPGMEVDGCYQFRVTRNSDLLVEDEEVDDLLHALEGELPGRRFGDEVRLEVADNCPEHLVSFLMDQFELGDEETYRVNGPVNLNRLMGVIELVDRPDLKFPAFTPCVPDHLLHTKDIFEAIRRRDILLHHPFESFAPVVDFLRQAARDRDVVAIKQTLYRAGADSAVVAALVEAARGGKEVTAIIELRARFDEEENIRLANRLHDAGAHVAYGVVGHKTHAKMALVVRREGRELRRYVHLGTGNYHTGTSRQYTDIGLLSCDEGLGEDVHRIFLQLTGLGRVPPLGMVWQAPFTLHANVVRCIDREADNARAGKPARIRAKMNSLTEPRIIRALYRASRAGVEIDLVVRGICCLRPGVPGVSESIRVRSVVGRFLEHSRIFCFENGGAPEVYLSSADWMERNCFLRVETCFPVRDAGLAERVVAEGVEPYLEDDGQAWRMRMDGSYERVVPADAAAPRVAQTRLMARLTG